MQVQWPIFIFCLLIHAGIYQTSVRKDRGIRLASGILVMMLAWVAWYGATLIENSAGQLTLELLQQVLLRAPYYMPFLSFLVYARQGKAA